MGSFNEATLIGRLGKDPEEFNFPSGKKVVKFSLATNKGKDKTVWHQIECWERNAELAMDYLKKGMQVMVKGEINYQENEKNGQLKRWTVINAQKLVFLDSRETPATVNDQGLAHKSSIPSKNKDEWDMTNIKNQIIVNPDPAVDDDDIPF